MSSERPDEPYAVRARGLGKRYHRLGAGARTTLREDLSSLIRRRPSAAARGGDVFEALADVSFDIRVGERVGVLGRNGAGKSTLLKTLCRITEPSFGWVEMRGRVACLLEVGTGFHPELSGRENIFLNGAILGLHRSDTAERFDAIVDFAEIGDFLDTPVKRYSSGMYVRLAFSIAAHLDPDTLIVDEVLAVGDLRFREKCLQHMRSRLDGRSLIFVSHDPDAIRAVCGRGLLIEHGRLAFDGPIDDAIARYTATTPGDGE